ncbi:hypothetical protein [Snodgrassella alvi]|uniref:hypothetical protein n=1 Tax=Snodgrassella alvi TaxID=1196083 RepID=UPI001FD1C3F2|nr:hypothetical protein [Snodgrassella alvi]UOO99728.1 hypothetical protein LVJ87_05910 [Snodgrassella alvi wkB2]
MATQQKRGSAILVGIIAICLLAGGLYIGGWFNLVTSVRRFSSVKQQSDKNISTGC